MRSIYPISTVRSTAPRHHDIMTIINQTFPTPSMKRLLHLADNYLSPAFQSFLPREVPSEHFDTQDAYVSNYELPGVSKEELNVEILQNHLRIEVRSPVNSTGDQADTQESSETPPVKFSFSQKLPPRINREAIEAKLENGILSLRYPKLEEIAPKKINVQ